MHEINKQLNSDILRIIISSNLSYKFLSISSEWNGGAIHSLETTEL
jgi:hypothetical protein